MDRPDGRTAFDILLYIYVHMYVDISNSNMASKNRHNNKNIYFAPS